jgi:hypothetical protein
LRSVPEAAEFVGVEDRIVAEDGKVFGLGLSDEHAVEGILVQAGEESGAGGVSARDGERFEQFRSEHLVKAKRKIHRVGKLSDAGFRGDFPRRSSADDDDVGARADEFAGAGRKSGIIAEPPEQGVGVQKNLQRSPQSFELIVWERLEKFGTNLQSFL